MRRGPARDKTLLYAAGFAVFALWPYSGERLLVVLAFFSAATGVVGVVTLLQAASVDDPDRLLVDGRLGGPVEYVNGSVALWMMAFWPAIYLASARRVPPIVRGAFQGIAVLLLGLTLLGQSRGWLFVLPLALPAFLLLSRQRLRTILALALAAAPVAIGLPWVLRVSERAEQGVNAGPALDRAAIAIGVAALAAGVAASAVAVVDRRLTLSSRVHRSLALGTAVVALLAVIVGTAAASQRVREPDEWLAAHWNDFTTGAYPEGPDRLSGALGTNRYAEWRVALREFRDHPVTGIGADNYAAAYLEHRPTELFHPRYPHSTPLRLLSQLGLIGTLLFATTIGIAAVLALRRRRRLDAPAGGAVGAAVMVFTYWLLHGSVDWFWEIPALAGPALGILAATTGRDVSSSNAAGLPRSGLGNMRPLVVAVVAVPAAAALLAPWLAGTYQEAAVAVWREQPLTAYERLDRAARLNPLSGEPLVVGGVIAVRRQEYMRAERFFERAREREPDNWFVYRQLGLLAARAGERERGGRLLERALRLNPRESSTRRALDTVRRGLPVSAAVLDIDAAEAD